MTGKVADAVMVVRNGEQIVRKYQPIVSNPSTASQIAARAKLKLISQVSAVLADYIAMPSVGNVSPRNLFVKKNYGLMSYANQQADIDVKSIDLTGSAVGFPAPSGNLEAGGMGVSLSASAGEDVDKVVYIALQRGSDNRLRVVGSVVASTPGAQRQFSATITGASTGTFVLLAYGVRELSEKARVVYGSLEVPTAQYLAQLVVTRTLTANDISLTETNGILVPTT